MTHIQKIKALLVANAMYFGETIDDIVLKLYAEDLKNFLIEEIEKALIELRLDKKQYRCPRPAQIIDTIRKYDFDAEIGGEVIASKILKSISSFGWNNSERAKFYLGERAWRVVELQGGWENLCKNINESNVTSWQAQLRDLADSINGNISSNREYLIKKENNFLLEKH